jgi:pentatricopeptide repeat protein
MLGEVERLLTADLAAFRSRGEHNDARDDVSRLGGDVSDLETRSLLRERVEDSELRDDSAEAGVGLTESGAGLVESKAGLVVEAPLLFDTFVCNALLEAYVDRGRWQEALGIFDRMQPPVGGSRQDVSQGGAGEEPSRRGAAEEPLWGGAAEESASAEVEAWGGYDDLEDWAEEGDLNRGVAEEATCGREKERYRGGTRDEGGRPEILRENYGWLEATFHEWLHEDLKRRSGLSEWKDGLHLELPRGLSGLDVLGPRDVFSYNLAMRACLRGRLELARIWALRDQMEREGLQPDRVSYNLTIAACCKLPEGSAHFNVRARGEDALLLIDEMERRGLSPNVYTYTAAIDAWGKANQAVSRALRTAEPSVMVSVFERMLHDGEKPNVVTYGALINGFAQMGALEDAEVAFESLLESGIPPNEGVVNALLAGCELAGDFERARAWVERLERGGVHSSDRTRTRLLSVRVNTGGAEKVVEGCETWRAEKGSFIEGMRALCEEVVGPDATLSGTEPLSAEPPQEASLQQGAVLHVETLEPTQAVEVQPTPPEATSLRPPDPGNDVALYKVLIQALAKAGRPEGLAPVLREMAQSGCLPDIVAHNIVLDACSRVADWEVTDAIVDSLGQVARAAAQQEAHVLSLQGSLPQQGQISEGEDVRALQVPSSGAGAVSPWQAASVNTPPLPSSFFLASSELLASRIEDDVVKARAHKLLSVLRALGERPETVLAFFSSLCDALWSFGWEKRVSLVAGSLLGPGFQRGFKDRRPLSKASDREWALDVRRLGKGAGQAVLFLWLQRAREEFLAGEKAPTTVAVVTGWGGQKWGRGELAEVIAEQLEALGSPFRVREWNPGRLSAYGYDVRDWLTDDDVAAKLVLSDGTGEAEEALEEAF